MDELRFTCMIDVLVFIGYMRHGLLSASLNLSSHLLLTRAFIVGCRIQRERGGKAKDPPSNTQTSPASIHGAAIDKAEWSNPCSTRCPASSVQHISKANVTENHKINWTCIDRKLWCAMCTSVRSTLLTGSSECSFPFIIIEPSSRAFNYVDIDVSTSISRPITNNNLFELFSCMEENKRSCQTQ